MGDRIEFVSSRIVAWAMPVEEYQFERVSIESGGCTENRSIVDGWCVA